MPYTHYPQSVEFDPNTEYFSQAFVPVGNDEIDATTIADNLSLHTPISKKSDLIESLENNDPYIFIDNENGASEHLTITSNNLIRCTDKTNKHRYYAVDNLGKKHRLNKSTLFALTARSISQQLKDAPDVVSLDKAGRKYYDDLSRYEISLFNVDENERIVCDFKAATIAASELFAENQVTNILSKPAALSFIGNLALRGINTKLTTQQTNVMPAISTKHTPKLVTALLKDPAVLTSCAFSNKNAPAIEFAMQKNSRIRSLGRALIERVSKTAHTFAGVLSAR